MMQVYSVMLSIYIDSLKADFSVSCESKLKTNSCLQMKQKGWSVGGTILSRFDFDAF